MNYLTEERRNALAAEYVLGTLQGAARVRFQTLMMEHDLIRQTVWRWERGLNELGGSLPSQSLDPQVWERIKARVGIDQPLPDSNKVVSFPPKRSARPWQWLAGLSTAAAVILAVLVVWQPLAPTVGVPDRLAVIQSEEAQPLWLIEVEDQRLRVRATESLSPRADRDYELWLVAADGRAPVSLGLLPKQGESELPRNALLDEVDVAALAVSLEPLGGSPSGQPTEVLYTAEPVNI